MVRLLLHDASFARAVQQKDGESAAAAAVGLVKSHFKAFASVLRPHGSGAAGLLPHADSGSPTAGRRAGAGAAAEGMRRSSDAGAGGGGLLTPQKPSDIRVKDRVVINVPHKRFEGDTVGKQGTVLSVTHNGWIKVQVGNEVLDFQMRHVSLLPRTPAGNAVGPTPGGQAGAGRSWGRKADAVKQLRKELLQMEEEVPWKEVVDRWKAVRQRWSKTLKVAETPQQFAGLMAELHDHLRTDKASGLFASNGPWEAGLMACVRGEAGMSALLGLWEDMKTAIQTWLAAGSLPGGLDALDRQTYEQAVATYAVLQEAASKGLESLEQVPLDQILTTQRDVLALQHVIQRELAATHSRLQVVAGGVPAAAAQPPPPLLPPDWATGGLNESLLMQLGKLPRLTAAGADTDAETGSDATDVGELDAMDVS